MTPTVADLIVSRADDLDPELTLRENADNFGINYNTFRREVATLEKQGILEKVDKGRYQRKGKRKQEEDEVREKDYEEMKRHMGWYKNYSIIGRKRWHRLWSVWRSAHEEEEIYA